MPEPTEPDVTHAYSRQEVEVYLHGVENQRAELEKAIETARARTRQATELEQRIVALEQRVGQWIVEAHVQSGRRAEAPPVFTDPPIVAAANPDIVPGPQVGAESSPASTVAPIGDVGPPVAGDRWEAQGA